MWYWEYQNAPIHINMSEIMAKLLPSPREGHKNVYQIIISQWIFKLQSIYNSYI